MKIDSPVKSAVILAGGLGTRLNHVVSDVPKPMAPINGRPFLEYQIDYWIKQGITHFVVSVGYKREVIMQHFGETYKDAQIEYVIEETPLGTGGGLILALEKLHKNEAFLLLNGDTFFEINLKDLIQFHNEHNSEWTITLFNTDQKRYTGIEIDSNSRIISLNSNQKLANGGVYLVEPKLLSNSNWKQGQKLSLEENILPALISKQSKIYGFKSQARFIDIGIPEDYWRSSEFLNAQTN